MPTYSKPHGDFQNLTQTADATQVNDQINQLYTAMNGGLDVANVPTLGDVTTLATTAKSTAVAGINEIYANYPIDAMSRQAMINGNFDIDQRGASFTNPLDGTYTLDRYILNLVPDGGVLPANLIHSQQTLTSGDLFGSYYFYRLSTDGPGNAFGVNADYVISQKIENGVRYLCGLNKKVTISFYARSSIANKKIGIGLKMKYGSGGSPSANEILQTSGQVITLTSTWQRFTITFITNTLAGKTFGTSNDDHLQVEFHHMWGSTKGSTFFGSATSETFGASGTIDITQVQVNAGDQALPFQPRSYQEELRLCQKYFEKSYGYLAAPGSIGENGMTSYYAYGTVGYIQERFTTDKRVAPTMAGYSPVTGASGVFRDYTVSTDNAITFEKQGSHGFRVNFGSLSAANHLLAYHWTADAEIYI